MAPYIHTFMLYTSTHLIHADRTDTSQNTITQCSWDIPVQTYLVRKSVLLLFAKDGSKIQEVVSKSLGKANMSAWIEKYM